MSTINGTGHKFTLADLKLNFNKPATTPEKPASKTTTASEPTAANTADTSKISVNNGNNNELAKSVSFVNGKAVVKENAPAADTGKASPAQKPKNIDTKAAFTNSNTASAADVDRILKHYKSPHAGKGQVIVDMCKKYGVNPVMMLAIMQQESQYGSTKLNPKLKPENVANPFSVHFDHSKKGIASLRLPGGKLPTFEQSLEGGIKTVLNLAGDSATPLTTAGKKYSESGNWATTIKGHYANLLKKY